MARESAWMETLGLIREADEIKTTAGFVFVGAFVMSLIVHIINMATVSVKRSDVTNYNPNYFKK